VKTKLAEAIRILNIAWGIILMFLEYLAGSFLSEEAIEEIEVSNPYRAAVWWLKTNGIVWYQYYWFVWLNMAQEKPDLPVVSGPFKKRSHAEGPAGRMYEAVWKVKFHFGIPQVEMAEFKPNDIYDCYDW